MTFDCYGTLLDWQSGFRRILAPVADGRIEALVEAFHAVEPEVERELSGALYKEILREGVARAAARAGVELPDRDLLVNGWRTLEAFPDTVPALRELQAQGWKLGILTNCDNDLFASTRDALGKQQTEDPLSAKFIPCCQSLVILTLVMVRASG